MAVFLTFNRDRCKSCELCVSVCPKHILMIDKETINSKGYNTVNITNPEECIGCANCARICPDSVITIEKE